MKATKPTNPTPERELEIIKYFDQLKQKHPDAILLLRKQDSYSLYNHDAVKIAPLLKLKLSELKAGKEESVKVASFPYYQLDQFLPKIIRSGYRVAIADDISTKQSQSLKENDMPRKKKEQGTQEEPTKTVKATAEEKPAKEQKVKVETKNETKAETKNEAKTEKKSEEKADVNEGAKQERKPREPQMVTANGEKVSHGHAFQSTINPSDFYFTAKIDGKQLKPQKMDAEDLVAFQKKQVTVPQLMERYYPTKLQPKVGEEAFKFPQKMAGPEGNLNVEKFSVYKEKDEQRPDFGKYKFFAQIGDTKMSTVASQKDLNAYFDRTASPAQLIEKNFGERLHMKSAYENYKLPEGVDPKGVRVAKDKEDNKWKVSVDLGEQRKTSKQTISFDDGFSLFKTKTATKEQIAAKYLNTEITGMLAAPAAKVEKSASLKM